MAKIPKLLIVDDHSTILTGITNIVEEINLVEITATANSGREALAIIDKRDIDILITDIAMDDIDGIELSKTVNKKCPHIKIIVLTQHSEPWIISKLMALDIGAIVLKSKTDRQELSKALKEVLKGGKYYSPEIKEAFFNTVGEKTEKPPLTKREGQILELVCKELTIKEIAANLKVSASTVESHRKNLFKKLKVKSQSGLVREAIKWGFYGF